MKRHGAAPRPGRKARVADTSSSSVASRVARTVARMPPPSAAISA